MNCFYDSLKKTFVVILQTYTGQIPAESLVLDIGCGMGQLTIFVSRHLHRKTIGVDIDPVSLKLASSRCRDGASESRFVLFDGGCFPFVSNGFEMAFAHEVIEHVPEAVSFLTEVHRLLKPGGFLIVTTPNASIEPFSEQSHPDHVRHYNSSELADLLTTSGLSVIEICFRHHKIAAFIDRVLSRLAARVLDSKEFQPHMHDYAVKRQAGLERALLKIYQELINPLVTWIEQIEFGFRKRHQGPNIVTVCQKPYEVVK